MSELSVKERYDQFQNEAVAAVADDFSEKPNGRYLLVIPTGGGKTFVAVRAVSSLFDTRMFDPTSDRIAWIAHRSELLTQAKKCFDQYTNLYERISYKAQVDFMMLSAARKVFLSQTVYKMAVIDEAHHGAAPSYTPMFNSDYLGILGLTATPSRYDGIPLDFERESYSIGFPELVELGVVLRPEVEKVQGGVYDNIYDFDDDSLCSLIDPERQKRIIKALLARKDDYQKIVVYAGTRELVRSIHGSLVNSDLANHYASISYVLGNENSRGIDRNKFFEIEKALDRSILVNVQVLSEGYDDPRINTIVMAAPTNSKLVYIQAIGRAIRINPDDSSKRAYVVEVEDELPNIRYRIDNRWLFSDISDALEPSVDDREFSSAEEFESVLRSVFDEYRVDHEYRCDLKFNPRDRITMLLFKYESPTKGFIWLPIIMNNEVRPTAGNVFNFLSQRMEKFASRVNPESAFQMVRTEGVTVLSKELNRKLIYNAMEAQASVINGKATPVVKSEYPWIAFISLRWHRTRNQLPDELINFTADMLNGELMLTQIAAGDYESGFYLIKLPLPLANTIGRIVTSDEFKQIQGTVDRLYALKSEHPLFDHRSEVNAILDGAVWPLEIGLINSTTIIARDNVDYYRELTK